MQYERPARRLVEWSPLHSNYFAYSFGEVGDGISLYHIGRPSAESAARLQMGARGSITDKPLDLVGGMSGFTPQQVSMCAKNVELDRVR